MCRMSGAMAGCSEKVWQEADWLRRVGNLTRPRLRVTIEEAGQGSGRNMKVDLGAPGCGEWGGMRELHGAGSEAREGGQAGISSKKRRWSRARDGGHAAF